MAGKTALLSVKILADSKGAKKGLDSTAKKIEQLEGSAKKAAAGMGIASGAVIAMGKQAFDQASALQQSTGAVGAVFQEQAAQIEKLAAQANQAVGLSKNEYQELATVMGAQLKNMGVAQDEVTDKTADLIAKGADLAATFGGTTADAVSALSSLMRGEADPIERYGVSIKKADINARMAADGTDKLEGAAAKAAETQALMALLTEQTADATGAFAREADTAAGQQQRAKAAYQDTLAVLGEALLPIVTEVAQKAAEFAHVVGEHPQVVQAAAGAILGITGVLAGFIGALKTYRAVTMAAKGAQVALNLAMKMSTFGLIVTAIAAVVAGLIYAYNHCEAFRNAVDAAGRKGKEALEWVVEKAKAVGEWIENAGATIEVAARVAWTAFTDRAREALDAVQAKVDAAKQWIDRFADNVVAGPRVAWDTLRELAGAALDWIEGKVDAAKAWIDRFAERALAPGRAMSDAMGVAVDAVARLIGWVRDAISWIDSMIDRLSSVSLSGVRDWVSDRVGFAAAAPGFTGVPHAPSIFRAVPTPGFTAAAPAPSAIRFSRWGGPVAAAPTIVYHVTVNGVLDGEDGARKIRDALDRLDWRQHL